MLAPIVALFISGLGVLVAVAPASAATGAVPEAMPIWRLRVEVTTGTSSGGGTAAIPAVRINGTSGGVTNLHTWSPNSFGAGAVTSYDLGLVATPADITMLRFGIPTNDDWCIRSVRLFINDRVAFSENAAPGGISCVTVRSGGVNLEWSSTALRSNPAWLAYGPAPTRPSSLSFGSLCDRTLSAIGSAMPSNTDWVRSVAPTFQRLSSTTLRVSYVVKISPPIDSPFQARITYDVKLEGGSLIRLVRSGGPTAYEGSMVTAAITQNDLALQRITADPLRLGTLLPSFDGSSNVVWSTVRQPTVSN